MRKGFRLGKMTLAEVSSSAKELFHQARWFNGEIVCPYCGEKVHIYQAKDGSYSYKCGSCGHKFTDKTRSLLHASKLSVETWMMAIYLILTNNGISSIRLALQLGINQKSAWLLEAKLRYAMNQGDVTLCGCIAQDEMYVGGCLSNFHYARKLSLLRSNHLLDEDSREYGMKQIMSLNGVIKQPVFGMNDGTRIVLQQMPNPMSKEMVQSVFLKHAVGEDTISVSDESKLYRDWEKATGHSIETNNHKLNQYRTEQGHTSNAIENTFSWFKRIFTSHYIHASRRYMQLYLNEFCFRYNTRNESTKDIFNSMVQMAAHTSITYKGLQKYDELSKFPVKKKGLSEDEIESFLNSGFVESISIGNRTYKKR